jgi:hypothetical protein
MTTGMAGFDVLAGYDVLVDGCGRTRTGAGGSHRSGRVGFRLAQQDYDGPAGSDDERVLSLHPVEPDARQERG